MCYYVRYVLDGDRDELRNIRHELANLRIASMSMPQGLSATNNNTMSASSGSFQPQAQPQSAGVNTSTTTSHADTTLDSITTAVPRTHTTTATTSNNNYAHPAKKDKQRDGVSNKKEAGNVMEDDNDSMWRDSLSFDDTTPLHLQPTTAAGSLRLRVNTSEQQTGESDRIYVQCIQDLTSQLNDLLSTGLYHEDDIAIQALRKERLSYQKQLKNNLTPAAVSLQQ